MERLARALGFGVLGLLLCAGIGFLVACAGWGNRATTAQLALAGTFGVSGLVGGLALGAEKSVRLVPTGRDADVAAFVLLLGLVLVASSVAVRLGVPPTLVRYGGTLAPFALFVWGRTLWKLRQRLAREGKSAAFWRPVLLGSLYGGALGALVFGLHALVEHQPLAFKLVAGTVLGAGLGALVRKDPHPDPPHPPGHHAHPKHHAHPPGHHHAHPHGHHHPHSAGHQPPPPPVHLHPPWRDPHRETPPQEPGES